MKKNFLLLCQTVSFVLYFSSVISAAPRVAVSVIFSSDLKPYQESWQGFKAFLDEKGLGLWVSKHNLGETNPEEIFSKVRREKPDLVFALGTRASKLARERIKDVPVVFSMVLDPGMIVGPNISGVSLDIPAKMKLREVKRVLPNVKKIGLIYSSGTISQYREISQTCQELGFQLIARKIDAAKEFPRALKEIAGQADCFLMIPDPKIYFPRQVEHLLLESLRRKFPVVGLSSFYTKAGALISFDCDYKDLGRQAGEIALKIIDGENPADIQPQRPRKIKFSLNLLTAERLEIKIPSAIIKQASEVER